MEYNTNRFKLIIPEYGRNIQKMINYAIHIKDRKKRNQCAFIIIKLMTGLSLSGIKFRKFIPYFQNKLWNQLLIMSNYKLDIDTPFPIFNKEKIAINQRKIMYPKYLNDFRHYGKIIRNMINVAIRCKNLKKKEGLFYAIANTMKKHYLRWNKKMVEDDIIFKDLKKLSKGKICFIKSMDPLLECSYILRKHHIRKI